MHHLKIAGLVHDRRFHKCVSMAEALVAGFATVSAEMTAQFPTDYEELVVAQTAKLKEMRGCKHVDAVLILLNDEYLGGLQDFVEWCQNTYKYTDKTNVQLYNRRAKKAFAQHMKDSRCKYAYLDITVGEDKPVRMVVQLFSEQCPMTCANFLGLCNKEKALTYLGTIFHRVVPGAWVQGGDVGGGSGDGGYSVYGETFEDESFACKHTGKFDVGMASAGKHSNRSQFYIATSKLSHLDNKKVVFGRIVSGSRVVKVIEKLELDKAQRPLRTVSVTGCGEVRPGE